MNKPIRVLIADNDLAFSKQLKVTLEQNALKVVSIARDGHGAIEAFNHYLPDVALIDLHLPVVDGVRVVQAIRAENEHVKILATSAVLNDRYALEAIKVGAQGYVRKGKNGNTSQEIIQAIQRVADNEVVLDPDLASVILQEFS